MRITSVDEIAKLTALRCAPERVPHVRSLLADSGILLRGHFQLQSGVHAAYFLRVRGLTTRTELLDALAQELLLLNASDAYETVICPESAGFALGEAIARLADRSLAVVKTDINRRPSSELRTGTIPAGGRVLLVNDVATSGSSLRRLHHAATSYDAVVHHVLTLASVGQGALKSLNDLGVAGSWLLEGLWPMFPADSCDLCKQDVPLVLSAELG